MNARPKPVTFATTELAERALRISESRYRRLFEAAQDGILLLNAHTAQIEDVNPYLINMLGYSHQEFLGKKLWEVGPFVDMAQSKEMFSTLQEHGYIRYDDLPLKAKSGVVVPVEFVSNVYDCEGIQVIQCNIRNISERHADRASILRFTQLYATLSQCNKAIVHCTSEAELFQTICRVAVQFGGMKMAWVGMIDSETQLLQPQASFGDDAGYLKDLTIPVDGSNPRGLGPVGRAIRDRGAVWCQDFLNDAATTPWHARAKAAGLAASASLPLFKQGLVVGAFNLYAAETEAFAAATRELLGEMADDISFALDRFDGEALRRKMEEEVKLRNTILKTQQETSLDGILVISGNGKIISYNQQFVDLWQLPRDMVSARADAPVLMAAAAQVVDQQAFVERVHYLNMHHEERSREEVQLKDGRIFDRYSAPVIGADLTHYGRVWYFRDLTESKKAQKRITYLNRVYAMLSGINSLIVRIDNRQELFRESCRIAVDGGFRMALIAMVDPRSQKLTPVASQGKDEALLSAITNILASDIRSSTTMSARALREKQVVVSNRSQDDPQVLFSEQYIASGIRSMAVFPLLVADVAVGILALYATEAEFFHGDELKLLSELAGDVAFAIDHLEKQDRLNYLAYYDALTGLANQQLFQERVAQAVRSGQSAGHKVAVALIDLERFRDINESLGRAAGDELLRKLAQWLTRYAGDANIARIWADHFAVLMPVVNNSKAVETLLAAMMKSLLACPFRLNDAVFRVSAKVGVALSPDDGTEADMLFRNAEAALKKAKSAGERCLFYTHSMNAQVARKLTLENQLRQAVRHQEFVLHYQPKVNLMSGKVTSAEALIRWNKPDTGLVAPGHFIPVLEEIGLIHEVGRWAMGQASTDYRRWIVAGLQPVRIAVNVSALQLRNHAFIEEVRQLTECHEQAAAGLELEITESLIMADIEHGISSLQAIRALGLTIAIDDFGTGFSSLSYLSKLPVDTLKIDRSFVTDMTVTSEGLALISTIINLAHALKLKVVAEGVETEEQARLLRLLNCDEMQGYLFSKPVPVAQFEARFLARTRSVA
jgi:diguanylate cyclase (GGDEF)-like protein/PAS domain S-box-containing protein